MKIVVLDGHALNPGDLSWEGLNAFGETTVYENMPDEQIVSSIGDAEAVLINKAPITRETLAACPQIRYVGVLATGYNTIDLAAAKEHGVVVSNVPTYGTAAVAQYAIAMLLEICNRVGHHSAEVRSGRWSKEDWCFWDYPLIELEGKTIGIIGYGRIGRRTGEIARALGMNLLAYDANAAALASVKEAVDLPTLLAESDVVSLHCPLFPETVGMINKETIARMKTGAILLNNSRGPLVVDADLADALNSGKLFAAGLDVVSEEPINADNPLLTAKNCFITPHISWAPKETRQRLLDIAFENLQSWINGKPVNVVNP